MSGRRIRNIVLAVSLTMGMMTGNCPVWASDASLEEAESDFQLEELRIPFSDQEYILENHVNPAAGFYVKTMDTDEWGDNLLNQETERSLDEAEWKPEDQVFDIRLDTDDTKQIYLGLKLSEIKDLKLFAADDGASYITYTDSEGKEVSTEGYAVKAYEETKTKYAADTVYVRSLPNTSGEQLSKVTSGSEVQLYGEANGENGIWYVLRLENGYGFTCGVYYTDTKPAIQQQTQTASSGTQSYSSDSGNSGSSGKSGSTGSSGNSGNNGSSGNTGDSGSTNTSGGTGSSDASESSGSSSETGSSEGSSESSYVPEPAPAEDQTLINCDGSVSDGTIEEEDIF